MYLRYSHRIHVDQVTRVNGVSKSEYAYTQSQIFVQCVLIFVKSFQHQRYQIPTPDKNKIRDDY